MSETPSGGIPPPQNGASRPAYQTSPPERDEADVYYDLADESGAAKSKSAANPFAQNCSVPPADGAVSGQKPTVVPFAPPGWNSPAADVPQSGGEDRMRLFIGLGIIVAAILVLLGVLNSAKPPLIDPPIGFVTYTATDNSFVCQAPIGWAATVRAVSGGTETHFEKKYASIVILSVPAGSSTLETLDLASLKASQQAHSGYTELPIQAFPAEIGDGLIAPWSAKGSIITKQLRGYRVMLLGHGRAITIVCTCSARNWKALHPAFFEVSSSIAAGTAQAQ